MVLSPQPRRQTDVCFLSFLSTPLCHRSGQEGKKTNEWRGCGKNRWSSWRKSERKREKVYSQHLSRVSSIVHKPYISTKIFSAASSSSDSAPKNILDTTRALLCSGYVLSTFRAAGENCDVLRLTSHQLREIIHLFEGLFSLNKLTRSLKNVTISGYHLMYYIVFSSWTILLTGASDKKKIFSSLGRGIWLTAMLSTDTSSVHSMVWDS